MQSTHTQNACSLTQTHVRGHYPHLALSLEWCVCVGGLLEYGWCDFKRVYMGGVSGLLR